jgi:hypothetical protein
MQRSPAIPAGHSGLIMSGKDRNSEARQTWDPPQAEDPATQAFIGKYLKLADIALGGRAKTGKRRQHVKAADISPATRRKAA